ncbi:MAG: DMT family transporter [Actinomycetia bacterium]|nr:DMT family transporter [Actinomycetes bacterium]
MRASDWVKLVTLGALWGGSFAFIRVAAPAFGPPTLVDARVLLAGLALTAWGRYGRSGLKRFKRHARIFALLGLFNAALPFTAIAWAELAASSAWAAIIIATTPLFAALVSRIWLREPLGWGRAGGLALGVAGVVILVDGMSLALPHDWVQPLGLLLLGALCYAASGVYTARRAQAVPPLDLAWGQQWAAGLWLLPVAVALRPAALPDWPALGALGVLAVVCTAFAYILYFQLIQSVGATRALSVNFLVPLFGVLWGVLLLGEKLSPRTVIGLALVMASLLLVLRPGAATRTVASDPSASSPAP